MKARTRRDETGDVRTEIKVWMARRRMSAADVAARLGHAPSWVSKRVGVGATVALTVDDLVAFSEVLDVPVVEFFRLAEPDASGTINYRKSA